MRRPSLLLLLLAWCLIQSMASSAGAEVRTISATGEYRMGDNDTRADAKRLALQDAKRLALEMAGTLIESITEVKQFQLTRDEVRAYTAGVIEIAEHRTRASLQGETTVIYTDVTAMVDMEVLARQISSLKRNEAVSAELVSYRQETERLRQALEVKTQELASVKTKAESNILIQQRQQMMNQIDVQQLLAQTWTALAGDRYQLDAGTSTPEGRARAKGFIKKILSLNPNEAKAYWLEGVVQFEDGDKNGGVRLLYEAIHLKPDYAEAHANLGVMLAIMGQLEQGINSLRDAIRIDPDFAKAHANLSNYLAERGDIQEALLEARRAIQLKPDYPGAHLAVGRALIKLQDYQGALEHCRTAQRLDSFSVPPHGCMGIALDSLSKHEDAIREYREYLRLAPKTSEYQSFITYVQGRLTQLQRSPH